MLSTPMIKSVWFARWLRLPFNTSGTFYSNLCRNDPLKFSCVSMLPPSGRWQAYRPPARTFFLGFFFFCFPHFWRCKILCSCFQCTWTFPPPHSLQLVYHFIETMWQVSVFFRSSFGYSDWLSTCNVAMKKKKKKVICHKKLTFTLCGFFFIVISFIRN